MKSIMVLTLLMQLIINMPDKGASAVNFTLTGFDVVSATAIIREGKTFDYNRISDEESKFIVYGGTDLLDNDDKILVYGYQTDDSVKIEAVGATPGAEPIDIYNRYYRITD